MDTITKFKSVAILSPLFLASVPTPVSTDSRTSFVLDTRHLASDSFNAVQEITSIQSDLQTLNVHVVNLKPTATKWTKQMAARFDELANLEAFSKITAAQTEELESLANDRRRLEYPRTSDEILWEYHQR